VQVDRDEGMETRKLLGLTSEEACIVEMGRWEEKKMEEMDDDILCTQMHIVCPKKWQKC
jgi:hypothetical protein